MEMTLLEYCKSLLTDGKNHKEESTYIYQELRDVIRFSQITLYSIDDGELDSNLSFLVKTLSGKEVIYNIYLNKEKNVTTSYFSKQNGNFRVIDTFHVHDEREKEIIKYFINNINFYQNDHYQLIRDNNGYIVTLRTVFNETFGVDHLVIDSSSKNDPRRCFTISVDLDEQGNPIVKDSECIKMPYDYLSKTKYQLANPKQKKDKKSFKLF